MSNEENAEFSYEPETNGLVWREVILPTLNWHWENVIRADETGLEDTASCGISASRAIGQKSAHEVELSTACSTETGPMETIIEGLPEVRLEKKDTVQMMDEIQSSTGRTLEKRLPDAAELPEVCKTEITQAEATAVNIPETAFYDEKESEKISQQHDLHAEEFHEESSDGPKFPNEFRIEILPAEPDEANTSQAIAPDMKETEMRNCEPSNDREEKPWTVIADQILKAAFEEIKSDEKLKTVGKTILEIPAEEHFKKSHKDVTKHGEGEDSAKGYVSSGSQEVIENALEGGLMTVTEDFTLENDENNEPVANARDLMEVILQEHEEARRRAIGIPETETPNDLYVLDITDNKLQQETSESPNLPDPLNLEEQINKRHDREEQELEKLSPTQPNVDFSRDSEEVVHISPESSAATNECNAVPEISHQEKERKECFDVSKSTKETIALVMNEILENLDQKLGTFANDKEGSRVDEAAEVTKLDNAVDIILEGATSDVSRPLRPVLEENLESPAAHTRQPEMKDETSTDQPAQEHYASALEQEAFTTAVASSEQKTPTAAIENLLKEMEKLHDEAEMLKKEPAYEGHPKSGDSQQVPSEVTRSYTTDEAEACPHQSTAPDVSSEVREGVVPAEAHRFLASNVQEESVPLATTETPEKKEVLQPLHAKIQKDTSIEDAILATPSKPAVANVAGEEDYCVKKSTELQETEKASTNQDEQNLPRAAGQQEAETVAPHTACEMHTPPETSLADETQTGSAPKVNAIKTFRTETGPCSSEKTCEIQEDAIEEMSALATEMKILRQSAYDEEMFMPFAKKEEYISQPKVVQEEHEPLQPLKDKSANMNEERLKGRTDTQQSEFNLKVEETQAPSQSATTLDEKAPTGHTVLQSSETNQLMVKNDTEPNQPLEPETEIVTDEAKTRRQPDQDLVTNAALIDVPNLLAEELLQNEKVGQGNFLARVSGQGNDTETGDKKEFLEKMIAENQALFSRLPKSPEYFSSEANDFPAPRDVFGPTESTLPEAGEFYGASASIAKPDEATRRLSEEDMPPGFFDVRCEDTGVIIDESRSFYKRPQKRGRGHFRAPFFDYEQADETAQQPDDESLHSDGKQKPRRRSRRGGRKF